MLENVMEFDDEFEIDDDYDAYEIEMDRKFHEYQAEQAIQEYIEQHMDGDE